MGVDPGPLIAEAGLDATLFDDPENTIAYADAGRLLALCAERSGCGHLGLVVGETLGPEVLGDVGRLAQSSPDVGCALRGIILHLHLHDRGAVPALWICGDQAALAFTIHEPDVPGTEHIYDLAIAITYNTVKTLAGASAEPSEVRLYRPRPRDIGPYRHLFRTRLRFGADQAAVIFPASWLGHPLAGSDQRVHQEMMQSIDRLEAQSSGDLAARLKRTIYRMLIGGACHEETCLLRIAELFAIHRRTINRRLRAQGTSFQALIDETRYDIARQLLRDTRLPIREIAAALDYADASAFHRAFHRWSGTSPAAWRSPRIAPKP
jgi:AraC-like DNA-binding protein